MVDSIQERVLVAIRESMREYQGKFRVNTLYLGHSEYDQLWHEKQMLVLRSTRELKRHGGSGEMFEGLRLFRVMEESHFAVCYRQDIERENITGNFTVR